jgi:NAD(P)-dependent dehydrogenase (short-subunit alcohol dehydrogenase family)
VDLGLAGRRAVVTGGSKGIGLAIAHALAVEGADLAICARNEKELTVAADALRAHGHDVHASAVDVTDPRAVEKFVTSSATAMGGIDILVNNAGAAHPGNFESLSDEAWQNDLEVKLFSQIRCSRAVLPFLRASKAPRIININAVYARYPDPRFFATTVNRAACLNLSKAMAIEFGPERILVNTVNIGFVITPQWENIRQQRAPELTMHEFSSRLAADEVPLGRFGEPEEVAGMVAFLASDRASYITGASVDVAGGMGKYV